VILGTGQLSVPGVNGLRTVAALATVGEVPKRVANDIGFKGDAVLLAQRVVVASDVEVGTITVSATGSNPTTTATLTNAFARELISYVGQLKRDTITGQLLDLRRQTDQLSGEVTALDRQVAASSGTQADLLRAQRSAKIQQYGLLKQQDENLARAAAQPDIPLQIIQQATAVPLASKGFTLPSSHIARLVIAGVFGLLAGIALALVLARFDTRIRRREEAEQSFELPVIAEIPSLGRRERKVLALWRTAQNSQAADAFRLLAAGVAHSSNGNGTADGEGAPRTILVTSPGPDEGRSLVVANLAAAYAEVGQRVIVLSCDFRRPSLHRMFHVPNEQGLSEMIGSANGRPMIRGYAQETQLSDVRLVASRPADHNSAELLASDNMRRALKDAEKEADVVLLDTAPILASETAQLVGTVDAVLLVARAGKTTQDAARRAGETLRRLGAPLAGVALNCAAETPLPRGYYRG